MWDEVHAFCFNLRVLTIGNEPIIKNKTIVDKCDADFFPALVIAVLLPRSRVTFRTLL